MLQKKEYQQIPATPTKTNVTKEGIPVAPTTSTKVYNNKDTSNTDKN